MTNSGQSLPPELLTRVCEAVNQFDAAWQAVAQGATPPWIEDALRGISAADQPTFLRELLAIEVECRRRFGEQPIEREYKARFPRHAKLVDDIFREVQHDQAPETLAARGFVEEAGVDTLQPPTPRNGPRSANLAFQPGDVLHDYVLLEKLGQGGMGAVFKAQHSRLKKIVAIKVLPESRTADPDAVARFQREMEAVGQLRHPHVVEAYDAGDAEGTHYLVIEYVAGMDLATVIRSIGESPVVSKHEVDFDTGVTPNDNSQSLDTLAAAPLASGRSSESMKQSPLGLPQWFPRFCATRFPQWIPWCRWIPWCKSAGTTPTSGVAGFFHSLSVSDAPASQPNQQSVQTISSADACEIIRQTALGLQHAHERGLIHRDIKPSNLLLSTEGLVKVLDLGLARLQGEHPAGNLTSTGQVMGTVDYIAPEQVLDSHQVDARAGLYSLGCTLYHLLSGHPPYHGAGYSSAYQKMKAHETVTPPAIARQDIPSGVLAVLDKMLRKQPAERFASAGEVAAALTPFTTGFNLIGLLDVANGAEPIAPNSPMAGSAAPMTAELTEAANLRPPYRTARRSWGLWATGAAVLVTLAVWGFKSRKDSPDSTTSPPASRSSSVSPATEESKDRDRAAAEWALSVGGEVTIQVGDDKQNIKRLADLPPGAFQITFIAFNGGDVTDEGLLNLRGLRSLNDLRLTNTLRVTPKGMQVLTSLPNLGTLILDATSFTDTHLAPLRDCPKLNWLVLSSSQSMSSFTDAAVDSLTQMPELVHLDLGNMPLTNAGLKRLLASPKLSELSSLGWTKVTDEGLKQLANDPRWIALVIGAVTQSAQTAKGVGNLEQLPNLMYLGVTAECVPDASFEVARFPKLQTLVVSCDGTISSPLTGNLLARIARFRQIENLTLCFSTHVESAALAELSKLDRLTSIKFEAVPLTDEGLAQLANHPSLKQVTLLRTQVTAAGLAKFRAARPDVQIEADVVEPKTADRAAAEWVLSVGGNVTVRVGEQPTNVSQPEKLPTEPFEVVRIVIREPRGVTREGFNCLRGLAALALIAIDEVPGLTDEWLTPLNGLPGLKNLQVGTYREGRITDAVIPLLRTLPALADVQFGNGRLTDAGFAELATLPGLQIISFTSHGVTDAAVEPFLKTQVNGVVLESGFTKLTPHCVVLAATFPRLEYLSVAAKLLTDESVEALRVCATLKHMSVSQGNDETMIRLARLTQLVSLSLGVDVGTEEITDAAIARLKALPRLELLSTAHVLISDAGLEHIAAIASLKEFRFIGSRITPAGLAKFRAARPDVKVVGDVAEPNYAAERAAAEWVLSVGGEVVIQVGEKQQTIARLADLPPGAFQTKFVAIVGGDITDDGLLNLRGLRALNVLRLVNTPRVTPQGMQVLTSLPNLLSVILDGRNFTDEHLAALRDCARLTRLVLNTPSITDAAMEPLTQLPELVYLNLSDSPITDDGLKRLLSIPKLSELAVGNTQVTDDGLKLLANDPRWKALSIGSPQTAKGVDNLGQLPNLWFLDFATECLPDRAFDVSRFPKLQTVAVNGDFLRAGVVSQGPLTENHCSRIGQFRKIESLSLGFFNRLESAGLAELSKLDRLTSIKFEAMPLTDEGLAQFVNHSSLKRVTLLRTQVTPAGLAKFKAARPDVKIE